MAAEGAPERDASNITSPNVTSRDVIPLGPAPAPTVAGPSAKPKPGDPVLGGPVPGGLPSIIPKYVVVPDPDGLDRLSFSRRVPLSTSNRALKRVAFPDRPPAGRPAGPVGTHIEYTDEDPPSRVRAQRDGLRPVPARLPTNPLARRATPHAPTSLPSLLAENV